MKRALSGVLDFCMPEQNTVKQCKKARGTFEKCVGLGWAVGAGGCISGHGHPAPHLCLAWPGSVKLARAGSCGGRSFDQSLTHSDLRWKKTRLNASGHQIGSSLVCLTPSPCSGQGGLRRPPCSCKPVWASPTKCRWNSCPSMRYVDTVENAASRKKSLLALLGRQWIRGYWAVFIRISLINLS